MTTIYIPPTIEALKEGLGGIERLLTAKRWERAAIVYAWTHATNGRPAGNPQESLGFSIAGFAALGLNHLSSDVTVREYRKAWESAAEEIGNDDMLKIQPGDAVELPDEDDHPWKDHYGEATIDVQERVARAAIVNNPGIVQQAVETFPAIATAAVKGLAASPVVARKAMDDAGADATSEIQTTAWQSKHNVAPVTTPAMSVKKPFDFDRSVQDGVGAITNGLYALRHGDWSPTGLTESGLRLLLISLQEWRDGLPSTIHDEIDDFLRQADLK